MYIKSDVTLSVEQARQTEQWARSGNFKNNKFHGINYCICSFCNPILFFFRWKCNSLPGKEHSADVQRAGGETMLSLNCEFLILLCMFLNPAGVKTYLVVLWCSAGPKGKKREPRDDSGAEQHLSTSGQSEQTPAVHFRIHPAVTSSPSAQLRPPRHFPTKGFYWLLLNNPRCYSVESFTRKCLYMKAANF